MRVRCLVGTLGLAFVVLMGAVGTAGAKDEWFVLGEQTLKTANPSAEIKAEGSRWKRDVKKVKLTAEGADVQIDRVVLRWDNKRDEDIWSVGTIKSGGETAAHDAPGIKGRLQSMAIQYKILGDKPTVDLKIMGYD